jgi:hypothetical protein
VGYVFGLWDAKSSGVIQMAAACGSLLFGLQVVGLVRSCGLCVLVRSCGLCVRFAGC